MATLYSKGAQGWCKLQWVWLINSHACLGLRQGACTPLHNLHADGVTYSTVTVAQVPNMHASGQPENSVIYS